MSISAANGIYGLFALGGEPLNPGDRDLFGDILRHRWQDGQAQTALTHVEDRAGGSTLEVQEDEDGISLFWGWLGDQPRPATTGQANPSIAVVSGTFERSREETPRLLPGEWTFMRWDSGRRRLTIIASANLRDPLYYSRGGNRIAVAPSLKLLARSGRVSGAFNTESLLLSMGRARLRRGFRHQSILEDVWQLEPGSCVELDSSSHHFTDLPPPGAAPVWTGNFEDAVEEVRSLLRRIMREHLQFSRRSAVMLSGGLDSTILAWLLAEQGGNARGHLALSSAAAPDSGLRDETGVAERVADQLGLPLQRVVPDPSANPFRPSVAGFEALERPSLSQRHYLYEALYRSAADDGADMVLDGVYGEASLTAKLILPWHVQPVRGTRRLLRSILRPGDGPLATDWFHIQLADNMRTSLPDRFREIHDQPLPHIKARPGRQPLGYAPAVSKIGSVTFCSSLPHLRHATPFRDRRLMDLVAGMPVHFLVNRDQNRVVGRAVLSGFISDDIRLRRSGMPFSPDYDARLVAHASQARARIDAYRDHGAGDWLDLKWLGHSLKQLSDGETMSPTEKLKTQVTAMTAEFFLWWKDAEQQ